MCLLLCFAILQVKIAQITINQKVGNVRKYAIIKSWIIPLGMALSVLSYLNLKKLMHFQNF